MTTYRVTDHQGLIDWETPSLMTALATACNLAIYLGAMVSVWDTPNEMATPLVSYNV